MHYSGMQKMVYLFIRLHMSTVYMFLRFPEYQQGAQPQVAFTPLLRFFFRFSALARAEGTAVNPMIRGQTTGDGHSIDVN